MTDGSRLDSSIAVAVAAFGLAGCNAVLGIEPPTESNGSAGSEVTITDSGGVGTGSAGSRPMPNNSKDGGNAGGGTPVSLEWAQWPMPNPTSVGLPNAQSYDTESFAGVVLDLITGLQWQQAVDENSYTWEEASTYCAGLTIAGGGWRLPTRIELVSLVDYTNPNPVIDPNAFPQTPADYFWTASPFAGDPKTAWTVNFQFSDGMANKGEWALAHRVRCVR